MEFVYEFAVENHGTIESHYFSFGGEGFQYMNAFDFRVDMFEGVIADFVSKNFYCQKGKKISLQPFFKLFQLNVRCTC